MSIVVVGRGWVGQKVSKLLGVQPVSHQWANDYLPLGMHEVEWIINCAGLTGTPNVDACERNWRETIEANAYYPIKLLHTANVLGARLLHVSSGCIYSGAITSEDSDPNFFGSVYSMSKAVSDTALKDSAIVARIRMPFNSENVAKNLLVKIRQYAQQGKLWEGGPNSLTEIDEACEKIVELVRTNAPNGPYNLVNEGSVTTHEIARLMGLSPAWFTDAEFAACTVAPRSICQIPNRKIPMRPVEEVLVHCIYQLERT